MSATPNLAAELERRLFEQVKHERFLCDTCGEYHPLIEHRDCRKQAQAASAARARQAITPQEDA